MRSLVAAALVAALSMGISALTDPPMAVAVDSPVQCQSVDYRCLGGTGYVGKSVWGSTGPGHNCVSYVAYRLREAGATKPWSGRIGDAATWDDNARQAGIPVDRTPVVGAIAQWDNGEFGHVAYVETVTPDYIVVSEDNYDRGGGYASTRRLSRLGNTFRTAEFLHIHDATAAARYDNTIVQTRNTPNAQTPAWYVRAGKRYPIRSAAAYACLLRRVSERVSSVSADTLRALPEQVTRPATCRAVRDSLVVGERLSRGNALQSTNGLYRLVLASSTGNLVLYNAWGRAIWTADNLGADFLVLQPDGNLVAYRDSVVALWSDNGRGTGASRVTLHDDGNVVVARSDGLPVWSTNTSH